jgi:hypothetical protein
MTEPRGGEGKPERFPGLAAELVRLQGSCPEACGKSERVFRSRRSHFCVTRMVSGRLL